MKTKFILLPLLLMVYGCSKNKPEAKGAEPRSSTPPTSESTQRPVLQFTIVEASETKEQNQIKRQAATLLQNKDYQGLEEMAAKYRGSKERYANGMWKLAYFYMGLEPDDDAAEAVFLTCQTQIRDWVSERKDSITARVALGRLLISHAWKVRSSGWADSVKASQWQQFAKILKQAEKELKAAATLKEKCPIYWSASLKISLGLQSSRPEFDAIFQAAIKEHPDYWYYYFTRATFLLPRWYGVEGEWEKDLTRSADNLGSETGDMLYAQVVWDCNLYGGGIDVFEGKRISWERVDRGFDAIVKQFPSSAAAKCERAYLAAQAGQQTKARNYFAQVQDEIDLTAWEDKEAFDGFVKWLSEP